MVKLRGSNSIELITKRVLFSVSNNYSHYKILYNVVLNNSLDKRGRLRGLVVACWTTDHYHPCSN